MTLNQWLAEFKKNPGEIICFGTGLMAEEALRYSIISENVIGMVDNDIKKQGRSIELLGRLYPVSAPEDVIPYAKENTTVLIASGYFESMKKQLEGMRLPKSIRIVSFPELRVGYSADSEEFFEERMLKECLKEYESVLEQYGISGVEREEKIVSKSAYIRGNSLSDRPLVIPRIMIMPTTRCNLKCKGCSSLLPLFDKPYDVSIEQIIRDFEKFFSAVDECIRITVGGEPFLYPNLKEILEYLIEQKKVLGIMLITNSTILPKPEVIELLKNSKIFLEISDYGQLERMGRLIQLFEANNINFKVLTEQTWTDMGGVECRNRTQEELRFQYLNCDQAKVIKGFHNGRFHTCARSARMFSLGAYQSDKDYFDWSEEEDTSVIREKIRQMFYSETADACNYCDLGVLPAKIIDAGVQLQGNLRKSGYTIVDRQEYEELKRLAKLRK